MDEKKIISGIVMDEHRKITFVEICEHYSIPEEELLELVEYGVISSSVKNIRSSSFDYDSLIRILSALRLKNDLGMNMQGIALALELLERLEKLEEELGILQRHFENP